MYCLNNSLPVLTLILLEHVMSMKWLNRNKTRIMPVLQKDLTKM